MISHGGWACSALDGGPPGDRGCTGRGPVVGGGGKECGTQERWKNAIFPGHQQGFKNANRTGPLKYACHKVEPVVAAGAGAGVESHETPLPGRHPPTPFPPYPLCQQDACLWGAWECWTRRSLPNLRVPCLKPPLPPGVKDDSSGQNICPVQRLKKIRFHIPSETPLQSFLVEVLPRPDLNASWCQ